MKIIRLSFAILSLAGIAHGEAFTITSYVPNKGIVGIEYNGGRTNRPFSSFTAVEQTRITDWLADQEFESSGLSVEIEEKKTRTRSDHSDDMGGQTKGTTEIIFYEVTVANNTHVVLNDIQIECLTFYLLDITQSQRTNLLMQAKPGWDKYCRIDQIALSIAPGETRKFNTSSVMIRNLKTDFPSIDRFPGSTNYTKDDLEGFCVSVSRKDRTGEVHSKTYEKGRPPNERNWVDYTPITPKKIR